MDMAKEFISGNDALVVARDAMGRPQLFRQGEADEVDGLDLDEAMPFRDYPGVPAVKDPLRDSSIVRNLRDAGQLLQKGQTLDYEQSKTLYETAKRYHDNDSPLMNTERWLARFVEDNDLTYTDHDGRRYKMKGGKRYPVSAAPREEEFDDDEESDFDPNHFYLV